MHRDARPTSLAELLDEMTTEAAEELTDRLEGDDVRCHACGHRCLIHEGKRGICKVRFNERGRLLVPTNYVAALACDPTEKKPFFHLLPGSDTLTFGMLGCDLHCAYCFTGDTVVVTDRGPLTFAEVFELARVRIHTVVETNRADGRQCETTVVGFIDHDLELGTLPHQPSLHPHAVAGGQAFAVEIDEVKVDRRPAGDRVGLGQQGQHVLGEPCHSRLGCPSGHGGSLADGPRPGLVAIRPLSSSSRVLPLP